MPRAWAVPMLTALVLLPTGCWPDGDEPAGAQPPAQRAPRREVRLPSPPSAPRSEQDTPAKAQAEAGGESGTEDASPFAEESEGEALSREGTWAVEGKTVPPGTDLSNLRELLQSTGSLPDPRQPDAVLPAEGWGLAAPPPLVGQPPFDREDLAKAGVYARLLFGQGKYLDRADRIARLREAPDPGAQTALEMVLATQQDPLSWAAAGALARLENADVREALAEAADDPRSVVRAAVLPALAESGHPDAGALALERFEEDTATSVRAVAAGVLGVLGVREAVPALVEAVRTEHPHVRLYAAWALWRMDDPRGRAFLEELVASDDPRLAAQAVAVLAGLGDPDSLRAFLYALGSRHERVWQMAYLTLVRAPREYVREGLIVPEPTDGQASERLVRMRRRGALAEVARGLTLSGAGEERWRLLCAMGAHGRPGEQQILAQVLAEREALGGLEPLLRALAAPQSRVRAQVAAALRRIARVHDLDAPPQGEERSVWRRWWVEQSRARRVRDTDTGADVVTVRGPDGRYYAAAEGEALVPGVTVERIEREETGARVVVRAADRRFRITPWEVERLSP